MTAAIEDFSAIDFAEIKKEEKEQAERLGEYLINVYDPESVLDVGCATGLYLSPFYYESNIQLAGLEPSLREAREAGLDVPPYCIYGFDLIKSNFLNNYDLILCLEVAEHIDPDSSRDFVRKLCSYVDEEGRIVFSAAAPGQGGKGHINCQTKDYWKELFAEQGFLISNEETYNLVTHMKKGYHLGWLTQNVMVFRETGTRKSFIEEIEESIPEEKMNVDPETGGMKASKPSQLGFVDPQALITLGEVAGMGAEKYDKYNYLKGFDWSLCYNAMMRHAQAAWNGEDLDPESGLPHFAHAAWQALALLSFYQRQIGNDDRPCTIMNFKKEK